MNYAIAILCAALLAGCATTHRASNVDEILSIRASGAYHTVRSGESLWQISRIYGVDVDSLAQANSIGGSSSLEKGQVLVIPKARVGRPAVRSYSQKDSFLWPIKGDIVSAFGAKVDKAKNKGVDIAASAGQDVRASRSGTVVFCDEKLKGFGKTVILDHGDSYQTVYAYNSQILVRVGESISRNDVIARAGATGRAKNTSLHFEIRKNGESRDPISYLPRQ